MTAYGQRDPLIEYKAQAFKLFDALMVNIQSEICHSLFRCALSRIARKQLLHNRPLTPVKGSVLDIGYSPLSFLRRYKRWFR